MNRFQREAHEALRKPFNNVDSHDMTIWWYDRNDERTYRWLKEVAKKNKCTFTVEPYPLNYRVNVVTFTRTPERI